MPLRNEQTSGEEVADDLRDESPPDSELNTIQDRLLSPAHVGHHLRRSIAKRTPAEVARGFVDEVLGGRTVDLSKLQKTLVTTCPSRPNVLLHTTMTQEVLNQIPTEWKGSKVHLRKGRWKGKWTLELKEDFVGINKQWYLFEFETARRRFIPSLEQVFGILCIPHPVKKKPLYRVTQKDLYNLLKADVNWLTPQKRVVVVSQRYLRKLLKVQPFEYNQAQPAMLTQSEIPALLPQGTSEPPTGHQEPPIPSSPSKPLHPWQAPLQQKWQESRPRESFVSLKSRLKIMAKLLEESNQTLSSNSVLKEANQGPVGLLNKLGLVCLDITPAYTRTGPNRPSPVRQLWVALMLIAEPCYLPPPVHIVQAIWVDLVTEVQKLDSLDNFVERNWLLSVECMDLTHLLSSCCDGGMSGTHDQHEHGTSSTPTQLSSVHPGIAGTTSLPEVAKTHIHSVRCETEHVNIADSSSWTEYLSNPLSHLFIPVLVSEPVAVLWTVARVAALHGQDRWKLPTKLSPHDSVEHVLLWEVFYMRKGMVACAWCDDSAEVVQICGTSPRIIMMWDGAGAFFPVVKQDVFDGLKQACSSHKAC